MLFINKFICLLLCGSLFVLSGCGSGGSVSLEEALLASEGGNKALTDGKVQPGALAETADGGQTGELKETTGDARAELIYYVYVCGAVTRPGVYTLAPDSRIVAAIEAAGGFLTSAATEAVNLAEPIQDGMQITVPDLEEYSATRKALEREESGMVNLNTATIVELCTLSGIGEAKAEAILAYRKEIGGFSSIEQLKEVTGIGDSLFNQIKNSIYIE